MKKRQNERVLWREFERVALIVDFWLKCQQMSAKTSFDSKIGKKRRRLLANFRGLKRQVLADFLDLDLPNCLDKKIEKS